MTAKPQYDRIEAPDGKPLCPDCGTVLKLHGGTDWMCPVAIEAKLRGLLGKPGRRHQHVYVWTEESKSSIMPYNQQ